MTRHRIYRRGIGSLLLARLLLLLLMMVGGVSGVQADDVIDEGYYYIRNTNTAGYYLCPAWTYNYNSDMATPFLTTYTTGKDRNSVWHIIKVMDGDDAYYRLLHMATGKYLTVNEAVSNTGGTPTARLRLHLEASDSPGEKTLFFAKKNTNDNLAFRPKNSEDYDATSGYCWFDIADGNQSSYSSGSYKGTLGFWHPENRAIGDIAKWALEDAEETLSTPIISYNAADQTYSISYPLADAEVSIHYTTDGTAPDASSATYSTGIPAADVQTLKAIATKGPLSSGIAEVTYSPVTPVMLRNGGNNTTSFYLCPPMDSESTTDLYVTTSNVPTQKLVWLIEYAGTDGFYHYYHFKNEATGQYLCCSGNNKSSNTFVMKNLGADGTEVNRFKFRFVSSADGAVLVVAGNFTMNLTDAYMFKQEGNDKTNYLGCYADNANGYGRWTMVAADPKTLSRLDVSTDSYWKLKCLADQSVMVLPPTGTANKATADKPGSNPEWFFREVADDADPYATYYNIINGETGEYLYFIGTPGAENSGLFLVGAYDEMNADAYKFIVVRTAHATKSYNIIPKVVRNQPDQVNIALNRNGVNLRTQNSRNNTSSQWVLEEVSSYVSPPTISYDETTKQVTLSCLTPGASIYYTTDGTEPTSTSTSYSGTAITLTNDALNTIKAIAVKSAASSTVATSIIEVGTVTRTQVYYALHLDGTGYLKVNGSDASLSNENNFRVSDDLFGNGHSIWILTEEGYLQNNFYYLNVVNDRTLYLDAVPRTRWMTEDVSKSEKKHLYINDGRQNLYLSNDGGIGLKASTTKNYSACPITINETKWEGPSTGDLTLLSPQRLNHLRRYFTQTFTYSFVNDGGSTVNNSNKTTTRRVYAITTYMSGGDGKGSTWDVTADNVIYSKQQEGNVTLTATCQLVPADPIARGKHAEPAEQSIKFTLQPRLLTPDASKSYLMFYCNDANNRFPYDDGISEGLTVRTNATKAALTDEVNPVISWAIETDEAGFCSFRNRNTGRYLCFEADDYSRTDYGSIVVGATSLPADADELKKYKFRLYKPGDHGTYGACVSIIPYEKQFVIYASNGRSNNILSALTVSSGALSLQKPDDNSSKWKLFAYDVEHRLTDDWTIIVKSSSASVADAYDFQTTAYYYRSIAGLPANNRDAEIPNTYDKTLVSYGWTYTPDKTPNANVVSTADNSSGGDGKFTITVSTVAELVTGKVTVVAYTDSEHGSVSVTRSTPFNITPPTVVPDVFTEITSLSQITQDNGNYKLVADANDGKLPEVTSFVGFLDGDFHTVSGLSAPIFNTLLGSAVVRNLNLSEVNISSTGNTGAIAREATGSTRIYNVGILSGSVGSTGANGADEGYCGGLLGKLDGLARVINCFSYATVTGGTTVGGIVGYNNYATKLTDLCTMVVNCMMYGDITGGNDVYPVYGGKKITNKGNNAGVNNYNFYRDEANITVKDLDHYFCSWPVEEEYLTRFDYVRSALNANRELCAWWITGNVADTDLLAKWVYAPEEADYPILKPWGRYPSMINRDIDGKSLYSRTGAEPYQGKELGRLDVAVQNGLDAPVAVTKTLSKVLITDMDTLHYDYGYYKIQLPYYNDVFGNRTSDDHTTRYGGNYTDQVVVGWEVVSVDNPSKVEFSTNSESGYNFADRNCTEKDIYSVSGRIFAQGGYYYVPEGVTGVTIKARWAKAYYCANTDYARDRIDFNGSDNTSYAFTPAGTVEKTFHGEKVYDGLVNAQTAITSGGVYDNAIVLVGNVQHRNGNTSNFAVNGNKYGFTVMSVDLDFDCEPDYALPLQVGQGSDKPDFAPVRFDFVQVPDMGLVLKRDGDKNRLAVSCIFMLGHFEITETSALHFNELYFGNNNNKKVLAPIIFNGGQTIEFVSADDKGTKDQQNRTLYLIAGGNAHMRSLYQGNHNRQAYKIVHAPMSVMGGEFDECYLSGNLHSMVPSEVNPDSPRLYTNGGRFAIIAGAGQEAVNGSVYFQIDHSIIDEFYGGSTSADGVITGDISVQIDNSLVGKYCGGPMVGNMAADKTIATRATGTTFRQFFGAGNGGTSFTKIESLSADLWNNKSFSATDGDWKLKDNYDPMRWNHKGNNSYEARYHFEIWNLPSGTAAQCAARRYVYGAQFAATKTGSVNTTLTDCTFEGDFYGGGNLGAVVGDVTSTLTACTVKGSVFGAGYSATIPSFECYPKSPESLPWQDTNTSICHDYIVGKTESYTWTNDGKNGDITTGADGKKYVHTDYSLTGLGCVSGNVTVNIEGTTYVAGSVYGGGALASSNTNQYAKTPTAATTTVNLKGGTIENDVYGGGLGRLAKEATAEEDAVEAVAALVGNTVVNLNEGVDDAAKGCVVMGNIFGCNNLNGTPKGTATVNVYKTQNAEASRITNTEEDNMAKVKGRYDVTAVYGGGNLAAYEPVSETAVATVVIDGCDRTSIETVYGGGNAASTPATSVTVKGTYEINEVFGGGNGKDKITRDGGKTYIDNPGANVGYREYADDADDAQTAEDREKNYKYGTGEAQVNINGGTIHAVFGGSNTKGNVRHIAVAMLEETNDENGAPLCSFVVDEAYGGGKSAPMDGEARLEMKCIPGLKAAYGGAEHADIHNGVTLKITNGTYSQVFGGNNLGGCINGPIKVYVEETGCRPIIIGELYGGGNQAGYSVYGYKEVTTGEGDETTTEWKPRESASDTGTGPATPYSDPQVYVSSFTSIGQIFGGGYGETATMVGSPTVNINVAMGDHSDATIGDGARVVGTKVITDPEADGYSTGYDIPKHESGKIGAINTVFGGGNAAKVIGNTYVNVATESTVDYVTKGVGDEAPRKVEVKGANITGNVFGGGNDADVTGSTNVVIGAKKQQ